MSIRCTACKGNPATVGLLCDDCSEELATPLRLSPEQVVSTGEGETAAALIDRWGRPHRLSQRTLIGRKPDGPGISILDPSISRHHAHLAHDPVLSAWRLRDLGSANGTTCNAQPVHEAVTLHNGDLVAIGQVGFYFLDPVVDIPTFTPPRVDTDRPTPDQLRAANDASTPPPPAPRAPAERDDAFGGGERTRVGLPAVDLRLHQPTAVGGVIEVQGVQVLLTSIQYQLVDLLARRMLEEAGQPELVRGFVRTSELMAFLSWDAPSPDDSNVKQLVRRVRRALEKAEVGDLIEARPRFGYRLRVLPKLPE